MDTIIYMAARSGFVRGKLTPDGGAILDRSLAEREATCIVLSGNTLILGTSEGIYRSTVPGKSWEAANEGLRETHVRWLSVHPAEEGRVFAGFEPAGIAVSENAGRSWQVRPEVKMLRENHRWMLPYSPESGCVRGFYLQGDRAYAAVEVGGLLRSNNWGSSWELVPASDGKPSFGPVQEGKLHPDVHSLDGHGESDDYLFAPTGGGFYVSTDGGATFERRYPPCYCRAVWVDPDDRHHLVLGPADGVDRNGRIMKTQDGGDKWQPIESGLDTPWPRTMVERFFAYEDYLLALLSDGRLYLSTIGQWHWQPIFAEVEQIRGVAI